MAPEPLGPKAELVDSFLDHVARLAPSDVEAAVLAWRESQRDDRAPGAHAYADDARGAWVAAEDAAIAALVRTRRGEAAWSLQDRIHGVFRHAVPWHPRAGAFGALRSAVTAEYLVGTAAMALLVADVLPPRHLARLYAPFLALVPLGVLVSARRVARA